MPKSDSASGTIRIAPRSFRTALKAGVVAALVTAIGSLFLPDHYCSEVKILPSETKSSGGLGQMAAAAAAMGIAIPGADSGDANFADILKSRSILEDLLKTSFNYEEKSWRFGPIKRHQGTVFDYLGAKNMDRGYNKIKNLVTVSKDLKTKILTIKVDTTSADLSQQIAQKLSASLEIFISEKGRTRGTEKARFAEARLNESRDKMQQSEEIFHHFLDGNRNYMASNDPGIHLLGNRLETELKLRQQLVLTLAVNLENALLESKNDVPIVSVMDEANLPIDKSGPMRSGMALLALVLVSGGTWGWINREWVWARRLGEGADEKRGDSGPVLT